MAHKLWDSLGFRRLFAAQVVSSFGDWLATFALMAVVLDISGSAAAVGGILALRLAPAAIAGPLLSFAGSHWGRRRLLLSLDLIRAGIVAVIPLVRSLWWVFPLTFGMEVATVLAIAARDTSIRDVADEDHLPTANGAILGAGYGSIPLGAGAFSAITWFASDAYGLSFPDRFHFAFWLDAATFLISFTFIARITEISTRPDLNGAGSEATTIRLRDALRVPLIRGTLPALLVASLGIGTMFSLGIGFVRDTLGASDTQFGLLVLAFGFGAAGGLAVRQTVGGGGIPAVRVGVAAMGVVLVLMSRAGDLPLAFISAAGFGAAGAYAIVSGLTHLQLQSDTATRFLGLGAFHIGIRIALSIGALAAGAAADLLSALHGPDPVRTVMLISGLVVVLAASAVGERRDHHRHGVG